MNEQTGNINLKKNKKNFWVKNVLLCNVYEVLFLFCDVSGIYEGGLKSKFRFVITFLFLIVHT